MTSIAILSCTELVVSPQKIVMLVRPDMSLVIMCWLFPITFLSAIYLVVSRTIWSITFLQTEVRLAVVCQIIILAIWRWTHLSFLVIGDFPQSPGLSRDNRNWHCNKISQLSPHPCTHPSQSCELVSLYCLNGSYLDHPLSWVVLHSPRFSH